MKIFISSLIAGFEPFRKAARNAVEVLRHQAVMAEDFGAKSYSPQIACLHGLRESDLIVLIMGERYGATQVGSGISATHEEYREAKERKAILVFVQEGVTFDSEQAAFLTEVQSWQDGYFRGSFRDVAELQTAITRAIHDHELANVTGSVDSSALEYQATRLLPEPQRNHSGSPILIISIVGGPLQQILRPALIENSALIKSFHQQALFCDHPLFDTSLGVTSSFDDDTLNLIQEPDTFIKLNEQGSLLVKIPAIEKSNRSSGLSGSVLIEETVFHKISAVLTYFDWAYEKIDATQRMTHIAIAAAIFGSDHLVWRTAAEHEASPHSMSMSGFGNQKQAVSMSKGRASLRLGRQSVAEDLLVRLRRQWKK